LHLTSLLLIILDSLRDVLRLKSQAGFNSYFKILRYQLTTDLTCSRQEVGFKYTTVNIPSLSLHGAKSDFQFTILCKLSSTSQVLPAAATVLHLQSSSHNGTKEVQTLLHEAPSRAPAQDLENGHGSSRYSSKVGG
jgi:hypothetical protein